MTTVAEEKFTCDCGGQGPFGGSCRECIDCWEVEARLKRYLRHEKGRQFVAKALEDAEKCNPGARHQGWGTGKFVYQWPRPKVCVDIAVFSVLPVPSLLLILRGAEPEKGKWALPGGHMEIDETTLDAAARELVEETGLSIHCSRLQQVGTFDRVDRHPGDRAISVTYTAEVVDRRHCPVEGRDDAKRAEWFSLSCLPEVAFDHLEIVRKAAYTWFGATKVVP